jgi:translation initiation factor 1
MLSLSPLSSTGKVGWLRSEPAEHCWHPRTQQGTLQRRFDCRAPADAMPFHTTPTLGRRPEASLARYAESSIRVGFSPPVLFIIPPVADEQHPMSPEQPRKSRGRVDIIRQKAGRGGKTVTVITHFVGIGLPEKEALAKKMQKACGTGGTVKEGRIEIQGDKREEVARILLEAGFRPVFAGG